jgi:hypothetical protein
VPTRTGDMEAAGVSAGMAGMAVLVKVAKLERLLREERERREQETSELMAINRRLELELLAEQRRRMSEQLRAIIEGATRAAPPSTALVTGAPLPA